MNPKARRWLLRIGIPVGIAAVLLVGGPFVYIHFISSDAPAKLRLPASQTASTAAAGSQSSGGTVALDGRWTVAGGSQAGYRVKEVLFGQSNTAVGRTTKVGGEVTIEGTKVPSATITVDLASVSSDESRRDNQFRGRIMSTATFPTATFTLSEPITLDNIPADGVDTTVSAKGRLTMHGATKDVVASLSARRSGNTVAVTGSIPVTFADWGIPNPSFSGITTEDHGTVEFLVNLTHA